MKPSKVPATKLGRLFHYGGTSANSFSHTRPELTSTVLARFGDRSRPWSCFRSHSTRNVRPVRGSRAVGLHERGERAPPSQQTLPHARSRFETWTIHEHTRCSRCARARSERTLDLTASADSRLLPAQVEDIMLQLQNSANYMPQWQTEVCCEPPLSLLSG